MHILVSNDDGYTAPGIKALAAQMRRFGRVTVVAPEHNHSGSSNSLTLRRPVSVRRMADGVIVVSGTPSDCVHLALTGLVDTRPDLVVSGINGGANMGDDTMYSGTVAAAAEGFIFGVDSIAFSQIDGGWHELESAAGLAGLVVERLLERKKDGEAVLLNVNMPNMPFDAVAGIRATRLGRRASAGRMKMEEGAGGVLSCWLGPAGKPRDTAEGTDFWATSHGFVSVTPLKIDLTAHGRVADAAAWMQPS